VALQAYMGHAHFSTTERYVHYVPAVEGAAKLTEVFGGGSATPAKTSTATPTTGGAYRRR
jgi:hypothetical protein